MGTVEKDDDVNINRLLEIDENNLETELGSCPSYHYMFAELATEAEKIYNENILLLEQHELKLSQQYKQEHEEKQKGSKYKIDPLTETEIKRLFRGDDTWVKLKQKEIESYAEYKKLSQAQKSFDMKNLSCMAINKRQLFKAGENMGDV